MKRNIKNLMNFFKKIHHLEGLKYQRHATSFFSSCKHYFRKKVAFSWERLFWEATNLEERGAIRLICWRSQLSSMLLAPKSRLRDLKMWLCCLDKSRRRRSKALEESSSLKSSMETNTLFSLKQGNFQIMVFLHSEESSMLPMKTRGAKLDTSSLECCMEKAGNMAEMEP